MKDKPRLIFYDFEVFSKSIDPITGRAWWMVVLVDYETKKGKVIVNDLEELRKYYNHFKNDIFVGFNSRQYDQYVFKGLLLGMDAGFINDKLILEGKKGWQVVREGNKIPFNNFDLMPNPPIGLKTLEGFMGSMIKETSVSFDLDRPLTKEEIDEVISYCIHDVKESIRVYEARTEEFESQLGLIDMFDLDMALFNKTKAQLSAFILGAEKHPDRDDEFDFIFPKTIKLDKYNYIKEWYEDPKNRTYTDEKGKKNQLITEIAGIEHVLGFGGIHAAKPNYYGEGIILCCDVASLYPSIMINYDFLSRNVKEPYKFKEIRDTRLDLKKKGDKKEKPLKIVINSTFGASKDKFNPLYDPLMANNVCIAGQLLLVDLIEKVEPYCELIQSNTDGIYMKVETREDVLKIKEAANEWEVRTGLDLDWDEHVKIYQKDVNNYILIPEKLYNDEGKPRWKTKGAYLKKLNDLDFDLPIVNEAMVNYFVHNTSIEETVNNCDDLRKFQKIVKLSSAYDYTLKNCTFSKKKVLNEATGRMKTITAWDENGEILPDKTFRVFASLREEDGGIFKKKEGKNPEKFANTPEKCFINNDNIIGLLVPDYLDKQYYINMAQERINQFLGIKPEKKKKKKDEQNS